MKTALVFLALIVLSSMSNGQEIKSYNLNIKIDAGSKKIEVEGFLDIDFKNQDSISLILWKNSTIYTISSNSTGVRYIFNTLSKSPIIYIPDGAKLTLANPAKVNGSQSIFFKYDCDMHDVSGWGKSFTDEWIEIGYYCAWFPLNNNSRNFTSKINIAIDDRYKVSGSGIVDKKDSAWTMTQPWTSFDNIILASKNLRSKKMQENGTCIETVYTDFPEADVDSVILSCKDVLKFYQALYGKQDSAYLKFAISPAGNAGGYSRKSFISLRTKKFDFYTQKGIAHEMAHFWWKNANTTTWEDWLNESFAEYSMLMYLHEKFGDKVFNEHIDLYKKNTAKSVPIWGIDRATPEAYSALYEKGSLILNELEQKLGDQRFINFLCLILKNNITTTKELLDLLEKEISIETRIWFENKLKS
jgi:hypothetical protein